MVAVRKKMWDFNGTPNQPVRLPVYNFSIFFWNISLIWSGFTCSNQNITLQKGKNHTKFYHPSLATFTKPTCNPVKKITLNLTRFVFANIYWVALIKFSTINSLWNESELIYFIIFPREKEAWQLFRSQDCLTYSLLKVHGPKLNKSSLNWSLYFCLFVKILFLLTYPSSPKG